MAAEKARSPFAPICALLLAGLLAPWAFAADAPTRVLFVGNSITYGNNVPAMVAALAWSNGKRLQADMLVKGGQTISGHLEAGVMGRALRAGAVDVLVLQEQGGAFLCFRKLDCDGPKRAHVQAVALARAHGASVILLGTAQLGHEGASRALEAAEGEVAAAAGIGKPIVISETGRAALRSQPDMEWLDADGAHPGEDLSMLMAIRIHHRIHHSWPHVSALRVIGTDYVPNSRFWGQHIIREPAASRPVRSFSRERMEKLITMARRR